MKRNVLGVFFLTALLCAALCGAEVKAADILPGSYEITVDSSASMFRVVRCQLTADGEGLKARMTMSGRGYGYVYPGTAEEAAAAEQSALIPPVETEEGIAFDFPVGALDAEAACAAYSIKKDQWYDRTLVFRSDALPLEAYRPETLVTPASLGLADGVYRAQALLEGGSGKAAVESPAELTVSGGEMTARIVMSSSKYDYVRIGETIYPPVNTEGHSAFRIPVPCFDHALVIYADTTAMSVPHEIEYRLTFFSEGLE